MLAVVLLVYTSVVNTVPIGFVMTVTPHIGDNDQVTLNDVRCQSADHERDRHPGCRWHKTSCSQRLRQPHIEVLMSPTYSRPAKPIYQDEPGRNTQSQPRHSTRGQNMKIGKIQKAKQRGFTLIEIAIVLVIIGLLLGGGLQGQQLIENSRVKSAINDFTDIATGAFSYQDRYGRLPGDDGPNLTDLTGRGDAWADVVQGDADGVIDAAAADTFTGAAAGESGDFFQHVRAAGFIGGDAALTEDQALPQNPFGGLIGVTTDAINDGLNGTKLCMSNVTGAAAIALDTQLDDGDGASGRFRGTLGTAGENTAPDDTNALTAPYSEDDIYTVCYRI